ncbi:MAG TPA: phage tail tip lysozyme [Candidatus Saccharimonadales bacterium]|nr:phage tail tip lysozyme [Candidatus Saccharimonadales bacterium]
MSKRSTEQAMLDLHATVERSARPSVEADLLALHDLTDPTRALVDTAASLVPEKAVATAVSGAIIVSNVVPGMANASTTPRSGGVETAVTVPVPKDTTEDGLAEVISLETGARVATIKHAIDGVNDNVNPLMHGRTIKLPKTVLNYHLHVETDTVPAGSNLSTEANKNNLTIGEVELLNPDYKNHPDQVRAGDKLITNYYSPNATTRSPKLKQSSTSSSKPKVNPSLRGITGQIIVPELHVGIKGHSGDQDSVSGLTGHATIKVTVPYRKTNKPVSLTGISGDTSAAGAPGRGLRGSISMKHYKHQHNAKYCSSTGHIPGSNNEEKAMNYFIICDGDSVAQAAGRVGNLEQESSISPSRIQDGGYSHNPNDAGDGGYGIAQWTPGRKILSETRRYGIKGPVYTLQTQLRLISAESRHRSPTGKININRKLRQAKNPSTAAATFEKDFEAAKDGGNLPQREANARIAKTHYETKHKKPHKNSFHRWWGTSKHRVNHTAVNPAIADAAKRYDPVSYSETMDAGHYGAKAWEMRFGKPDTADILDCTGLVTLSEYTASGGEVDDNQNTKTERETPSMWKRISFKQLAKGDIEQPNKNHVEIVTGVKGNTIYTFGAHTWRYPQPKQVGPSKDTYSPSKHFTFLRYVGPHSPLRRILPMKKLDSTSASRPANLSTHTRTKPTNGNSNPIKKLRLRNW